MQTMTSAMSPCAAELVALMRLIAASLEGRSLERCEPTMMIGTGEFCTMNERIAAVWCIVSVPWPMMMPATPALDLAPDRVRRADPLLGPHVLAEDAVELLRLDVADVGELGHRAVELARREGRDDGARAVVEARGDRAARCRASSRAASPDRRGTAFSGIL